MEVKAVLRYARVQPRKVRIIADEVRGKSAPHAAALLRYHSSKSAKLLRKVLVSAMANAEANNGLNQDHLVISAVTVDEGPRLKRMQARAMGRGNRIIKKTSHITVVVEDSEPAKKVKAHGTKAKPRPKFEAPKAKKAEKAPKATVEAPAEPVVKEVVEVAEVEPVTEADAPEEGATEANPEDHESSAEAEGAEEKENS